MHLLSIKYNSPLKKVTLSKGHPFCNENVASVDGDNVAEFDYLSASEIWPEKRGGFWWEWSYKRRGYCIVEILIITISKTYYDRSCDFCLSTLMMFGYMPAHNADLTTAQFSELVFKSLISPPPLALTNPEALS